MNNRISVRPRSTASPIIGICAALLLSAALQIPQTRVSAQENPAPVKPAVPETPVELESDRKPALVTKGNCLIRGGTVITVTKGVLANTDVLIRNGKITEIGKNLTAPAGFAVFEAAGKFVTPGIVDAHSHIASDSTNEGTDSITPEVRIHDVLNPESISVFHGLSNGVTTSLVLHGSANAIGGQSVVIKMKWKRPVEELPVSDAPRMVKFALGENVKRSSRSPGESARYPSTRMGVESVYRRAFTEAKVYMQAWDRYEKAKLTNPRANPPRKDLRLETLADILKRNIWVQCHCYRADEMLMMVRLSQEFGFKIGALQHALEAYKIAPELAKAQIPISTFADSWAYKVEAYDAIPFNAAFCMKAGVLTSVNSDNSGGTYRLNLEAAKCMKFGGLTEEQAWKLITINPAGQLGVEKRTGSIDVGKDADIAVWEGHPFTTSSKCVMTMVEGDIYFQRRDAFGVDKNSYYRQTLNICPVDHLAISLPPNVRSYAIVGATIHPISSADISNGTILFEDGKIKALGAKISVPKGYAVVQGKGMQVYPGFFDAGSQLGLEEIEQVSATIDTSEPGTFQPDLRAWIAVNASSEHIGVSRVDGVTTSLTHPAGGGGGFRGGGSLISGQGGLIDLAGWTSEEMNVKGPTALYLNFPEAPRGFGGGRRVAAANVQAAASGQDTIQIKKLKEYIDKAKFYQTERTQAPDRTPLDAQLEAMLPYVSGKLPIVFNVSSAAAIRKAVDFAEQNGLKIIIESGSESLKAADLLARKNIPVIYKLPMENSLASQNPLRDYDPYDAVFAGPGQLAKAGVKVCFASENAPESKNLPTQVGITRGYGMPDTAAIKALTLQAAEILGVSDKLGSLEIGKIANIIITDGDPLEITTHLHGMFIDGKPVSLENRHTKLYQKYMQRK